MKQGILAIFLAAVLGGCTTTEIVQSNSTPAIQAKTVQNFNNLIEIGILPLDPGIPATEHEIEKSLIIPDVRKAEANFIAYHLKDTLEMTGNWGPVRVIPQASSTVDLVITGKLTQSDGELLKVNLKATDATGRTWLSRGYDDSASKFSYEVMKEDPFQDLYNKFANDLLLAMQGLTESEIDEIKSVAQLSYASGLSPEAFDRYLDKKGSRTTFSQLPAANDPMMVRVERIKEKEYLFVDTMDEYYGSVYREMKAPYHDWRQFTYEEAIKLRQIKKQATAKLLTGAALIAGGLYAGSESGTYAGQAASVGAVSMGITELRVGLSRRKDAQIHAESLKELSQSLGSEITPVVLDVEGRTIELQGTVDVQYTEWRRILREIYAEESGLTANDS